MPNLYLIEPKRSTGIPSFLQYLGYAGTYDSAVVCAESEAKAKCIHPDGVCVFINGKYIVKESGYFYNDFNAWVHPNDVQVTFIGVAAKDMRPGAVICASYNEG